MAGLAELILSVKELSDDDKLSVLQQVLGDLHWSYPNQEIVVRDERQQPLRYCIPAAQYQLGESPEFIAELKRRVETPGPTITTDQLLADLGKVLADKRARRQAEQAS